MNFLGIVYGDFFMIKFSSIESATIQFFKLHWSSKELPPFPEWSDEYHFVGEIFNNEKQGCYVLLKDNSVVYIGSAVSKGNGLYTECGIGYRFNKYLRWDKTKAKDINQRHYLPKEEIADITSARTIGFSSGFGYLALALEAFLIVRFKDQGLRNIKSPR
jgi:hypothetical protein